MCRSRAAASAPRSASGRVDFAFSPIAVAVPDIRDGRLLALAVSGRERVSALPDVPTTLEAGYPNSDYVLWFGMFVPAKTPRAIVDRLHAETMKALETPALRDKLAGFDVVPMPTQAGGIRCFHQGRDRRHKAPWPRRRGSSQIEHERQRKITQGSMQ